jgi:hypothetical protein
MGKNKANSFASGRAAQGRAERAVQRHSHAIAKAHQQTKKPPSALAIAIAAARQGASQPRQGSGSVGSSSTTTTNLNLHLAELNQSALAHDVETTETLLNLVREAVSQAGGRINLTELGGSVRVLAAKRCLQAKFEGEDIQKKAKACGGWERFVHDHAPEEFVVVQGTVCKRQPLPEPATSTFEFEKMPAPRKAEVESLTLDAVGLGDE